MFLAGTADARGFRQWKEAGRYPVKGSKAFHILVPLKGKKTVTDDDGNEEERPFLFGFKAAPVFAVESTDGKPVDHPDLEPPHPPPLVDVAQHWGISIDYLPGTSPRWGFYQPSKSRIGLSTHDTGTFLHELAHAAHERVLGPLKLGQDWRQEVTAELTSAVLLHLYGETDDGGAYQYIREYAREAGKDPHKACMSVLSDVSKCLSEILGAHYRSAVAA